MSLVHLGCLKLIRHYGCIRGLFIIYLKVGDAPKQQAVLQHSNPEFALGCTAFGPFVQCVQPHKSAGTLLQRSQGSDAIQKYGTSASFYFTIRNTVEVLASLVSSFLNFFQGRDENGVSEQ